jgi:uncharacterized protein (DUF362 family)
MKKLSRRDLLLRLAAGAGALTIQQFLAACTPKSTSTPVQPTTVIPTQSVEPTTTSAPAVPTGTSAPEINPTTAKSNTSAPTNTSVPQVSPTPIRYDMVVVRNGEPDALVRKAIEAFGGMNKFIKPGAKVIIKPNICVDYHTYEYAATTNPWVVGTLVKMCKEAGAASVRVMDQPFGGTAKSAYAKSGIEEQVKANGGEMVIMSGYKYVTAKIPDGIDLKSTVLYDEFLKADAIINVPIAKTHSLAGLTLAMKNLMGVIDDRPGMHSNLGQRLADIYTLLKPTLNVIDAVRILTQFGPTGGDLNYVKKLDTILVSQDIVAADTYAAGFFNFRPEDLSYIKAGAAMKIGRSDLNNLKIQEINLAA